MLFSIYESASGMQSEITKDKAANAFKSRAFISTVELNFSSMTFVEYLHR